jgi:hypothetical protein
MSDDFVVFEATHVSYFSPFDEDAFFEWLGKLPCTFRGKGATLFISLKKGDVSDEVLRELVALFQRYGVDLKQLAVFRDDDRWPRFSDPQKSWYAAMFS